MTSLCSNNIKESLSKAWTRFKDLLQKVPHHGIFGSKSKSSMTMSISSQDKPSINWPTVKKITYLCEICSGPYDTQYCMENTEQDFVEYASSRTDKARIKCLVPQSSDPGFVCMKGDDGDVMFIEIIKKNDDSCDEEPEVDENFEAGELRVEYVMSKILGFHKECMELGPKYLA
nr:hypothetical protein [Tanacetum cinerariifolium]